MLLCLRTGSGFLKKLRLRIHLVSLMYGSASVPSEIYSLGTHCFYVCIYSKNDAIFMTGIRTWTETLSKDTVTVLTRSKDTVPGVPVLHSGKHKIATQFQLIQNIFFSLHFSTHGQEFYKICLEWYYFCLYKGTAHKRGKGCYRQGVSGPCPLCIWAPCIILYQM